MPNIVLTYFNCRDRGELSRLILAAGGLEYKDNRIGTPFGDTWKEMKPNTPFGGLPVLEYDGEIFAQSVTIARFLAKKTGLASGNDLEQAKADMIVDYVIEFMENSMICKVSNISIL